MPQVRIVTDSSSCLPEDVLQQNDIHFTPLNLVFGDTIYRDQKEINTVEFWKLFHQASASGTKDKLPTTTAASVGDFRDIFTDLSKTTDSIVCITISSGLSATYDSALQAKELARDELPGVNIEIVDSLTTGGALGLIVLRAARAAAEGKSLEEVTTVAKEMVFRSHFVAMVDTLYYLSRLGRAPKVVAWAGDILKMKPLIGISGGEGTVQTRGRVRTEPKAMMRMVELIEKQVGTTPVIAIVHHTLDVEKGERLKGMFCSRVDCREVYLTEFTPVMCTHTGPLMGISFQTL